MSNALLIAQDLKRFILQKKSRKKKKKKKVKKNKNKKKKTMQVKKKKMKKEEPFLTPHVTPPLPLLKNNVANLQKNPAILLFNDALKKCAA